MFQYNNNKFIEYRLLEGLAENNETGYANALRKIPRNMLLLYIHAYQSLIWNKVASRRVKEFGLKLIPGDLVYNDNSTDEEILDAAEEDDEDEQPKESYFKQKVHPLSEEDIASGKYTIFDVVLPQPGFDITYPANEVGKWYEEYLAESQLSSEKLKNNVKTYSLPGAYRKMLVKPGKMTWEFKTYDSPIENLIETSFEKVAACDNGQFKALVLDFQLPSSCYATMFLREILRNDTSASNQSYLEAQEMSKHNDQVESKRVGSQEKNETVETQKVTESVENQEITDNVVVGEKRKAEDNEIDEVEDKKIKT